MIKSCDICGKEFVTKNAKKYCSKECYAIAQKNIQEEASYKASLDLRRKKAIASGKRLADTDAKAKELGMSYGKYKAMMYLKEMGR